ncbi:hypothetical protein BGZ60DRAFT_547153 [Tricladium varicosporioides]|nr:hypothetical protein BGZ60DRAFT_547153 [Hymenoscyphus varicosporioides]
MKFLFTAMINHEKVISKLVEALSHIADNLPRVKLAVYLFPTERMQIAVAELNTCILKLLVQVHDWYREGKLKHIIHSITQPFELQYDDLLELISRTSSTVQGLAVSGQQVELRSMHGKVDEVNAKVDLKLGQVNIELEEITMIPTNYRLSDLQFSQIMSSIKDAALLDPSKVVHYLLAARHRTAHNPSNTMSRRF